MRVGGESVQLRPYMAELTPLMRIRTMIMFGEYKPVCVWMCERVRVFLHVRSLYNTSLHYSLQILLTNLGVPYFYYIIIINKNR